jgi:hypothetical protein
LIASAPRPIARPKARCFSFEAYHNYGAGPSRFMEVIERDHRAVVERVIAPKLAQLDAFFRRGPLDGAQQFEVVAECEPNPRRLEIAKVALEHIARPRGERARVERRMRRDHNNGIRPGVDRPA